MAESFFDGISKSLLKSPLTRHADQATAQYNRWLATYGAEAMAEYRALAVRYPYPLSEVVGKTENDLKRRMAMANAMGRAY